jgi:hypothetical protein
MNAKRNTSSDDFLESDDSTQSAADDLDSTDQINADSRPNLRPKTIQT